MWFAWSTEPSTSAAKCLPACGSARRPLARTGECPSPTGTARSRAGLEGPMVEDRLGRGLTLTEAGALVGCYCWIERRLFALTGSWVQEMEDPATQIHLDEVSFQHAWHAELWA